MSTSVGSIHYDLSLDRSKFDKAAGSVREGMGDMATRAVNIGKKIAVAFGAMTAAAGAFGIKSAADFEQTRIGIENMLGSADKAKGLLSDLSKFAAETPFEFPELAGAVRQLIAFGFSGDEAFKALKSLGEVAATSQQPVGDLAYLLGTVRTQGKALTIDVRQFAARGLPIYEYLAKVMGVTREEVDGFVTAGKVGFPEINRAIEMMGEKGGYAFGGMAKQSKSLSGLFSTLKDNIGLALREVIGINSEGDIRKGSIFEKLSNGVKSLNDQLSKIDWAKVVKIVSDSFGNFFNKVGEGARLIADYVRPGLQRFWEVLNQVASIVNTTLAPALGTLWNSIQTRLLPQIKELWNTIEPGFTAALKVLAVVFGVTLLFAIRAIIDITNATITVFGGLLRIVQNIVGWFGNLIGVVVNVGKEIWNTNAAIYDALTRPFRDAWEYIKDLPNKIKEVFKGLLTGKGIGGALKSLIPGFATGGFTGVGGANEMAGIVHKGEFVIPKSGVDQNTGLPKSMGNTNISFNAPIYIKDRADADYLLGQLMRDDEIMSHGMTPRRAIYGS